MSYRSDISILIYGDDRDVVAFKAGEKVKGYPKGMEYYPLDEPEDGHVCDERFIWHTDDGDTMLEYNFFGVNWWKGNAEVTYWEQLMSLFDQAFPSLTMEFARIGENTDDIEISYYGSNPQYYLAIERTIYKDIPIKEKAQDEYLTKYNS